MTIEQADARIAPKPWGSRDLLPWTTTQYDETIGEIWFERPNPGVDDPALLLKLLFTKEALSVQVHPDDGFAHSIGMPNGKTEAWYILSAEPGAQVAVGLKQRITQPQLRRAIVDGSIAELVEWRTATAGEIVFVPAGTIHAIGAGLVVAEIQQRSDTTFRLFDYGRDRALHVDQAVAAADPGPAQRQDLRIDLTDTRTQLIACPFFVLERVDLPPNSNWQLNAVCETWALVIAGAADIGSMRAKIGNAFFADASSTQISVGPSGLELLLAYADAGPSANLLRDLDALDAGRDSPHFQQPLVHHQQAAGFSFRSTETRP